jgi:hypothetical protein
LPEIVIIEDRTEIIEVIIPAIAEENRRIYGSTTVSACDALWPNAGKIFVLDKNDLTIGSAIRPTKS